MTLNTYAFEDFYLRSYKTSFPAIFIFVLYQQDNESSKCPQMSIDVIHKTCVQFFSRSVSFLGIK